MFQNTDGLRGRVLKARPKDPKPPRSIYRRFRVEQAGRRVFTISRKNSAAGKPLLYIHGGVYVYEIMDTQWKMIGKLLDRGDPAAPGS